MGRWLLCFAVLLHVSISLGRMDKDIHDVLALYMEEEKAARLSNKNCERRKTRTVEIT